MVVVRFLMQNVSRVTEIKYPKKSIFNVINDFSFIQSTIVINVLISVHSEQKLQFAAAQFHFVYFFYSQSFEFFMFFFFSEKKKLNLNIVSNIGTCHFL